MAIADVYKPADVLESLGWMGLSHRVRVAKAANLYLEDEDKIDRKSRNYDGPTKSIVSLFVKSLFKPPRGLGTQTVKDMMSEIEKQRKIRKERADNRPYRPRTKAPERKHHAYRSWITGRLNAIARTRYKTLARDYDKKLHRRKHVAVGIGMVGDTLLLVDKGDHRSLSRIYMKHKPTGREKVVVLEQEVKDFMGGLMMIAPEVSMRAMFAGQTITFDFDSEGFLVDGKTQPWRNVRRVYTRKVKGLISTRARPDKG